MSKIFYTGLYLMKRTGRSSPNAFTQIKPAMPKPETLVVNGHGVSEAWSLSAWEKVAHTRKEPMKRDMLAAIEELRVEEGELVKKHLKRH